MAQTRNSNIDQITRLRFLVAFLGEKKQAAWWDSSFLNPTGIQFLENAFPRTALSAAFNSASETARVVHDSKIGRVGVFHLFRFPAEHEDALQVSSRKCIGEDWPALFFDRGRALAELKTITGKEIGVANGPVHIGTAANPFKPALIADMAGHYFAAFSSGTPAYPYFGV